VREKRKRNWARLEKEMGRKKMKPAQAERKKRRKRGAKSRARHMGF